MCRWIVPADLAAPIQRDDPGRSTDLMGLSAMPAPLLFQKIVPVDDAQVALTRMCLAGTSESLMTYSLTLRARTDLVFASLLANASSKRHGRCEDIARELHAHLLKRLERLSCAFERVIREFVGRGGAFHSIWGVLLEQYFQNAIQLGGLYVDVSNDTVVVTKPKVEILPIEVSGLVNVRDIAHFRQMAERYWGATIYANHLVPSLAPLLPMISASPGRLQPGLQSACNYMIELVCRDGFRQAEDWLRDGPAPPPEIAAAVLAGVPPDLRQRVGDGGRGEAVTACREARGAGFQTDVGWRNKRVMDYLRMMKFWQNSS
ncbi:hypothetical protein GGE65_006583 [Skermanella aerolata]|uniref:hypothetical protein n=1 Tax=Skermanella aerolata TaxID=393310 RepID=UPI003D253787